jgi:mono/diheme cytochrome c family protein
MRDMYDQPRYKPLAASSVWKDGRSSRPLPADSVATSAGVLAGTSSGRRGGLDPVPDFLPVPLDAGGKPLGGLAQAPLPASPLPMSAATLARGQERFEIFCAPCHGPLGDGDGLVARRGFPHPPSYHSDRLRNAPDVHFFGVITHGYGAMYPYADRIAAADRWAIVAYIRALQRSQHASLADVPETERKRLEAQR